MTVHNNERDSGQHLVRYAEQRPKRVDAAHGVDHALIEESNPMR